MCSCHKFKARMKRTRKQKDFANKEQTLNGNENE